MNAAVLLLAFTLFSGEVEVLVLHSGHQLPVEGPVTLQDGKVVFRSPSGILYSLPLSEIDVVATEKLAAGTTTSEEKEQEPADPRSVKRLRVSEEERRRLLRELEKSRGVPVKHPAEPPAAELPADEELEVRGRSDEPYWRAESLRLEEQVRRRREDIEMLKKQIQQMEDEILTLLGIGIPPDQVGYQVVRLQDGRSMLEQARLELTRAERELSEFREQARRQGILPGWLR